MKVTRWLRYELIREYIDGTKAHKFLIQILIVNEIQVHSNVSLAGRVGEAGRLVTLAARHEVIGAASRVRSSWNPGGGPYGMVYWRRLCRVILATLVLRLSARVGRHRFTLVPPGWAVLWELGTYWMAYGGPV